MKHFQRISMLLLAFFFAASAWAQTWTASAVGEGTFYLYNVGNDGFLYGHNDWSTRASLTNQGGMPVTLSSDGEGGYYISTSPTYNNLFLGADGYVDKGSDDATNYTAWNITPVEGQENTYTLQAKKTSKYLFGHASDLTKTTVSSTLPSNSKAYWKLATREALIANLSNATQDNPVDATFLILDPYFGRVTTPGNVWSGNSMGHGGYESGATQNYCAECWNKTFDVYQSFSGVPNGIYGIKCQAFYRVGDGANDASHAGAARAAGNEVINAKVYVNNGEGAVRSIFDSDRCLTNNGTYNTSAAVNINGTNYYVPNSMKRAAACFLQGDYWTEEARGLVTDGTARVGIKKTVANDQDWTIFDNFILTYYGIDLSALVENYESLVNTATSLLTQPMKADVKEALNTALTTAEANVNKSSQESLEENSSLLGTAISNAQTSNTLYTGSILPAVNAMKAQSASESVKSAVQQKYDNGEYTSAAEVYSTYQTLELAALSQEAGTDYTSLIINPGFEFGNNGWEGGPAINGTSTNKCAERWNATFDVYQTITGLPNGYYDMSIQGFYRVGDGANDASKAAAARAAGNEVLNAIYYINDKSKKLMSIFDYSRALTQDDTYNLNVARDINGTSYYVPDNMSRAAACFAEGEYQNPTIRCMVTDGTLRIGISKSAANSQDWTIWDNVQLTYQGSYAPASYTDVAITLNIENDEVADYLANTTYDEGTTSAISQYNTAATARNDQPASANIFLPTQTGDATLYVSLDDAYTSPLTYTIPAGSELYELANLLPGNTYYYKVVGDGDAVVTNGTITTKGQLRMIKADGIANMRDLGGWTNADGNRIRYGKIFRGTELRGGNTYTASDADLAMLKNQLNIGAEVDLREDKDFANGTMNASAIDGASYTYANLNRWSEDALNLDSEKFRNGFNLILDALKADKAAYFHCIFGADRTGCFAFLLEGLLGLPVDQLYKDYELTSFSSAGPREKTGIDHKLQYIKALQGSTLQEKFYNYWRGAVGVSESDLNDFINIMIDGTSPITSASLADLPTPLVTDGEYYIYLPTVGKLLGRGEAYGARGLGDNYGVPVQITTNGANVSTIKCIDSDLYFGSDCFMDKVASYNTVSWFIEQRGEDLILKSHNGKYMGVTTETNGLIKPRANVASAAEAAPFTLKSAAEQKAIVAATQDANILAAATAAGINAADVAAFKAALASDYSAVASTATIKSANAGSTTDWPLTQPSQITDTKDNWGNAYNAGDYGGELYQRHGYVSQTVTVPHAGLYKLTLNALYRESSNRHCYELGQRGFDNLSNAYVSINDEYFAQIPSWYSGATNQDYPNTTGEAVALFNNGQYKVEVYAYIGDSKTADIKINVPGFSPLGWCIFNNFALTEYAKKVTVDEAATTAPEACDFANVTLTRTLQPEIWNTLSLPFDLSSDQIAASSLNGATIYEFSESDASNITFSNVNAIEAGKPYLVKLPDQAAAIENPSFTGVTIEATEGVTEGSVGSVQFVGQTYNKSLADVDDVCYLSTNGKVKQLAANGAIKGLRAYFIVPDAQQQAPGVKLFFNLIEDGIQTIANGHQQIANSPLYNLSGQRVNNAQKGIYIVNGKKILVK